MSPRFLPAFAAALAACSAPQNDSRIQFSSNKATLLNFAFDSEFLTTNEAFADSQVQTQLRYTIGQLNGKNSVGRLDATQVSQISVVPHGHLFLVRYHAVLPVGWSSKVNLPSSYAFKLPRDLTQPGLKGFVSRYGSSCVDSWSAHDVDTGNMWYYYRPEQSNCAMDGNDFVTALASVTRATENVEGRYPEMNLIWSDNLLDAVVIFGKDKPGATTWGDFGITAYGRFNSMIPWASLGVTLTHTPADIPSAPGAENPEVTWEGAFGDGRRVRITALLVNNVREANFQFDTRFHELSRTADIIVYNGHAALGDNVRALARKGSPNPGQYTIVSMMGCDSFAYVDGYMAQQRAALNPDDPQGTRYLDMITNIIPANPTWLPQASLALIRGVIDPSHPQTFVRILSEFENAHLAVVTGDEDNAYHP